MRLGRRETGDMADLGSIRLGCFSYSSPSSRLIATRNDRDLMTRLRTQGEVIHGW